MNELVVYLNGEFVPMSEAKVSIFDRGFLLGDAVFDLTRTYNHKPFRLREHLERFYESLRYVRIDPGMSIDEMEDISLEVLKRNLPLVDRNDDLWLGQNVTRGRNAPSGTHSPLDCREPTVSIYSDPIDVGLHASEYFKGIHVVTPSTRRTPPQCFESRPKSRNYLNMVMAEIEVKSLIPEAYPLLLDLDGNCTEGTGWNFFIVKNGRVITSTERNILCGVSRLTAIELAREMGMEVIEKDFTLFDVYNADEAFTTSSPFFILPVSMVNGAKLGNAVPGPVVKKLTDAWIEKYDFDFVRQALDHLPPEEREVLENA